ncbi:MAG: FtsK/SpoIIIE domain-containing protein [Acidimicrobiales bacterium]
MQIVFHDGGTEHELDVVVHDPDAVVADLARTLDPTAHEAGLQPSLLVDDVVVPGDRRLDRAAIFSGATIRVTTESPPAGAGPSSNGSTAGHRGQGAMTVAVVGGLDSGATRRLAPGASSIGRHASTIILDSPTVSSRHATIDLAADGSIAVSDVGSCNGTWVEGRAVSRPVVIEPGTVVRLGATQVTVRAPVDDDRPAGLTSGHTLAAGDLPFNRPPRSVDAEPDDTIEPPRSPTTTSTPSPIGIISIVAPLIMAGVMVKVYGNPLFAMFALLSPVMLVGNAVESRRRTRRGRRRDRVQFAGEVADFRHTLVERAGRERQRLEDKLPDPAEVLRRALVPSTHLWERRPDHLGTLHLRLGLGPVPWSPPVTGERRSLDDDVRAAIAATSLIPGAPVLADLSHGGVVGLVGDRDAALALARSLVVQAATHHGPADLPVMVLAGDAQDWDWAKWLPHTLDPGGSGHRLLSGDPETSDTLLRSRLERVPAGERTRRDLEQVEQGRAAATLVVLDDESLTEGRRSPARSVLRGSAGPVAGIVLAATEDRLPAMCTTVVELTGPDGTARVRCLRLGHLLEDVLIAGMTDARARCAARALARFEDPELDVAGAGLPATVGLLSLLGLDPPSPDAVLARWRKAGEDPDLLAPIGVTEDGVLALDLVRDGPHALVAGTTGAGKSELLRSLVAGLAASSPPDHLAFVLVDFKGGSAFDQCARLPHTVGLVTDLDAHLAERALRCLEAELRHRERLLRTHGVSDLLEYRRRPRPSEPLPRLMVVVDEFATLKAELPDFVESLVGIAQRGRSLGVHLVLATQRPTGAVNDNIRANTNLRIALRVQDVADSKDIIDVPDAARIGRNQPGRALARLGHGEVVALQTALSTGVAATGGHDPVELRPFRFGPQLTAVVQPVGDGGGDEAATELERLVDAMVDAHTRSGRPRPRRPWPDPLPREVDLDLLRGPAGSATPFGTSGAPVVFALADDPDAQAQYPVGWVPADGNLLLIGVGGSGTSTAATSLVLSVAASTSPDDLHVYALDFGAGELAPLAGLPHTGAVIAAGERERQVRLMGWLRAEIDLRRALLDPRRSEPRVLFLLDGLSSFRSEWDDALVPMTTDLQRVIGEGAEVGIHVVVTADRVGSVPNAIQSVVRQRWLFRLGDPTEFALVGCGPEAFPTSIQEAPSPSNSARRCRSAGRATG